MLSDVQTDMTFLKYPVKKVTESFLLDRKIKGLSPHSLKFYRLETNFFVEYTQQNNITYIEDITPLHLREFFVTLANRRNQGGVHACYRAVRALFFFFEGEYEPPRYKNPIRKVSIKAVPPKPLPGISYDNIKILLSYCNNPQTTAIVYCLANTGCRANEFLSLNVGDVDFITGEVVINNGKGNKNRKTFMNREALKHLRNYLKSRKNTNPSSPLWVNRYGDRMNIQSLRLIINTLSEQARIPHPKLHDFRRFFALQLLRSGVQVLVISLLLGHSSVEVTKRYLDINSEDLRLEHRKMLL